MSFQVGASCYGSELAAAQAAASSQVGTLLQLGGVGYVVDVASVSASSISYRLTDLSSTASFTKVAPFTPLPCGLLDTADGIALGWSIATCWLLVWGVLFLRRGLHNDS